MTVPIMFTGAGGSPTLALDLTAGADARLTATRAGGGATYFDQTNTMQLATANTQRIDYGPTPTNGAVTNWVRNSTNVGVVAGTPGTLPTNWTNNGIGLTQTVVGSGTVNGIPYVDIRLFGTNTSQFGAIPFEATGIIPAFTGQSWTASCYLAVVGGSTTNMSFFGLKMQDITNPNDILSASFPVTSTLTRFSMSGTLSSTAPVWIVPNLWYNANASSGSAIDITLRIGGVQLETGATANTFVPTSGSIATVGAAPLGLLVEEARTNGTRNARSEGSTNGVIGSGGVLPTNASLLNTSGLTFTVIGTGTETGLPYWDLQISGTSTNNIVRLALETTTAIAAADTQVWTNSLYCRLVGGDATNITTIQLTSADYTSVPALIGFNGVTTFTPTAAPLASQRVTNTSTLSGATIASIQGPIIALNLNSTTAPVNITLRISCPQCELGAFATSPILPAIGTPAATTRAKDLVTMLLASVNATAGTLACEVMSQAIPSGVFPTFVNLNDNSANNNIAILYDGTFTRYRATGVAGGVSVFDSFAGSSAAVIPAAVMKAAIAWASGSGAFEVNPGSSPVAIYSASLTTPSGLTTLAIGADAAAGVSGARYVRKVRYWPRALSTAELQAATT